MEAFCLDLVDVRRSVWITRREVITTGRGGDGMGGVVSALVSFLDDVQSELACGVAVVNSVRHGQKGERAVGEAVVLGAEVDKVQNERLGEQ